MYANKEKTMQQKQEVMKDICLLTTGCGIFSLQFWSDLAVVSNIIASICGAIIGVFTVIYVIKRYLKSNK